MRIGIVLHGPEIIDAGSAKKIIDIIRLEHSVTAKLGGTMGRTAVLDAGLEGVIDISSGLTPSETINALKGSIDLAILLNHGKTLETGRYFGGIVASKLASPVPLVHIERPDSGGRIIYYDSRSKRCAEYIRNLLVEHDKNYDLPVEKESIAPPHIRAEGDMLIRRVSGAFPGENIRLEGIVIGEATCPEPEIVCREGMVVELRGGKIKPHGIEKLKERRIDLSNAKVKTGNIRRTKHNPKIKKVMQKVSQMRFQTVAIIDHCAESTFELVKNASIVVTVGDDTTAVAADILARFGIPIIGITDGDMDCILEDTIIPSKSVIIRVREGFDDIVGRMIFENLMGNEQSVQLKKDQLLAQIMTLAEKYTVAIKYY